MTQSILLFGLLILSACAAHLPIKAQSPVPDTAAFATLASFGTFEMALSPAYTRIAVARHNTAMALKRGAINVKTAMSIQRRADDARKLLDDAHAETANGKGTPAARNKLDLAIDIIKAIEEDIGK